MSNMKVHIVKGIDPHDTVILDVFFEYTDALEFIENYFDESFANIVIDTRVVN